MSTQQIEVGSVFYSSWGYDQTNVDFYEVVGVTAASVKVRRVKTRTVRSSTGADYVAPVPGEYAAHWPGENGGNDKPVTKRLRDGCNGPSFLVTSYSDAYLWDGRPQYQTAVGWGH